MIAQTKVGFAIRATLCPDCARRPYDGKSPLTNVANECGIVERCEGGRGDVVVCLLAQIRGPSAPYQLSIKAAGPQGPSWKLTNGNLVRKPLAQKVLGGSVRVNPRGKTVSEQGRSREQVWQNNHAQPQTSAIAADQLKVPQNDHK